MRVIGIAGWSGSGKTTLLTKAIPRLVARGMRVSTLKHAHHAFDVDQPGKDSHTHRIAGATEVLISSANRWALMHELRGDAEPALADLLRNRATTSIDNSQKWEKQEQKARRFAAAYDRSIKIQRAMIELGYH